LPTLRSVRPSLRRKTLQQFTLEVQAEKEGARTTTVELSVPGGFNIESFADTPGWKRQVTSEGSCEEAHAQRVVWTGAEKSGRDDPVFHFTATLDSAKTYAVKVRQVYDDGSLVDWDGPRRLRAACRLRQRRLVDRWGRPDDAHDRCADRGGVGVLIAVVGLLGRAGGRPLA